MRSTLARGCLAGAAAINMLAAATLSLRSAERQADVYTVYDWCRAWLVDGQSLYRVVAGVDYPPNAIVMLAPLAVIPRSWIIPLWTIVAAGLAIGLPWLVVRCGRRAEDALVPVLLFLCWASTRTLLQFTALSLVLGFAAVRIADARPAASGVLLGLALFKPHVAGPIALWAIATRRLRMLIVAAIIVAAGWLSYDVRVGEAPSTTASGYANVIADQYGGADGLTGRTSVRRWALAVTPASAADTVWLTTSIGLLALTWWIVSQGLSRVETERTLGPIALFSLWSLLVVYHNSNNLIMLLPAFAFLWQRSARAPSRSPAHWLPVVILQVALTMGLSARLTPLATGWIETALLDADRLLVAATYAVVALLWLHRAPGAVPRLAAVR